MIATPTPPVSADSAYPQIWNNRHFFTGTDDPRIASSVAQLKTDIAQIRVQCEPFLPLAETAEDLSLESYTDLIVQIRPIHQQRQVISKQLGNVSTYIYTALSTDSQNAEASQWKPILQKLSADLEEGMTPLNVFLTRASNTFITQLLAEPDLAEIAFLLRHRRQLKDQLLSVAEEQLITALSTNGLHTWGNLYTELAGTIQCTLPTTAQGNTAPDETMGLAKAANLLSHPSSATRKAAWEGIRAAWEKQQAPVAAGLNAINGWRIEETQKRATTRELHYLDKSCHQARISRATLDALMETTYQQRGIGQRALNAMAKALGQTQAHPWDLMAPPPAAHSERKGERRGQGENTAEPITFDDAIALIADAFNRLTPEMGNFAIMMAEKGWIDGAPTPNRSTGAYCTKFSEPREPRIFMTYEGSMGNVLTLAHELGHAWHNWVMRDLSPMQIRYPMTLAETASIFAETLVREALMAKATTLAQQLEIAWQDAESASAFLVNIPARFEFEKRLVEARKVGAVRPAQMCQLMSNSWQKWYEDSLSQYDDLFWASKLHFSISGLSFYNYPYLFGYLFSLGIYAQQETFGDQFNTKYTALLRDTGTMTAEDLVQKHLQKDLSQPQFWQESLAIVDNAVTNFEQLVEQTTHS